MSILNEKQYLVIIALLRGKTIPAAATACDVAESTIRRWLHTDDDLFAELARQRREALADALNVATVAGRKASSVLVELLNPSHPALVRLRAATTILDMLFKWNELDDMMRRIARLENRDAETYR